MNRPDTQKSAKAGIDAIVVPTARSVDSMKHAIALAGQLKCTLVALCSKAASASAVKREASKAEVNFVAVDIDALPSGLMPDFKTSSMLRGDRFDRLTDTSLKRNFGLLLATVAGWERIAFLDDDIDVLRPDDLRDAAGLLDTHSVVGLSNGGYPDNSVVCHAYRAVGGPQETFVGGGALVVGAASFTSFFPNIYNEDWFFLLDDDRLRPTAITGLAVQAPYDPYANVVRARSEEFGDCLAEGVFTLLDAGKRVQDADTSYWREFLDKRRYFIDDVLTKARSANHREDRDRMVAALEAARWRSWLVEPGLCVEYLRMWRADRESWGRYIEDLRRDHTSGLKAALDDLGLMDCSQTAL